MVELGFVGCAPNPDRGGMRTGAPLTDRTEYPMFEKMVEFDVPAMIHISNSCTPHVRMTGAHYRKPDTAAFMRCQQGDRFSDVPELT